MGLVILVILVIVAAIILILMVMKMRNKDYVLRQSTGGLEFSNMMYTGRWVMQAASCGSCLIVMASFPVPSVHLVSGQTLVRNMASI